MNVLIEFNLICQVREQFLRFCELDDLEWPKGEPDYFKVTGHDLTEVPIDFWYTLKATPEAGSLIKALGMFGGCVSSTICTMTEAISKFEIFHSIVSFCVPFIPIQGILKAEMFPSSLTLIDDSDEEIEAWKGPKLLIPKPWNSGVGDPQEILHEFLSHEGPALKS